MTEQTQSHQQRLGGELLEGKYLVFLLAGEHYGLEIGRVQEIINLMEITKIPNAPDFVRGIINLRGRTIPAIELRKKFDLESIEDTDKTCIIVVEVITPERTYNTGIIVDEVAEVLDLAQKNLAEVPEFELGNQAHFVKGVGVVDEQITMLLDVSKIFGVGELQKIRTVSAQAEAEASSSDPVNEPNATSQAPIENQAEAPVEEAPVVNDAATAVVPENSTGVIGHISHILTQLTPGTKEHEAASALLENLQIFLDTMDGVQTGEVESLLQQMETTDQPLFQQLGRLVKNLHEQIKVVSTDIPVRLGEMAEHDMANATQRLEHIVEMTENAANITINLTEEMMSSLAEQDGQSRDLLEKLDQAMAAEGVTPETVALLQDVSMAIQNKIDCEQSFQGKLTEILMAQGYQDLTGQVVQKIVTLLNQLETELLDLVKMFGAAIKAEPKAPTEDLQGPLSEKSELKKNQDEVDNLLESLGF